ncbi:MAG: hypothetical protein R3C10_27390 [Pirellulales bacterium]
MVSFASTVDHSVAADEPRGTGAARPLSWEELPPLPDALGLGGPFAGVHGGALIVAGGANFPDGAPWAEPPGEKRWYDRMYVLDAPEAAWREGGILPRRLAYGVSISTERGVLLIGGEEDGAPVADVYRVSWNAEAQSLETEPLPPLPRAASYTAGGLIGSTVYVAAAHRSAGADTLDEKSFWSLDLAKLDDDGADEDATDVGWKHLATWPGAARHKAVVATQSAGGNDRLLYLFSGERPRYRADGTPDLARYEYLTDAYRYDPRRDAWQRIADMPEMVSERALRRGEENSAAVRRPVAAATAIDVGQSHILVFSGSTGGHVTEPPQTQPPFPRTVLAYHTITDTWTTAGEMPEGVVTTTATRWGERIVIPSGETRPGVRTPRVQSARLAAGVNRLGGLNAAVLIGYLAALVAMGFYFSRREKSTADYFLAGGRIPWWAAGLSIYATQLSRDHVHLDPRDPVCEQLAVVPRSIHDPAVRAGGDRLLSAVLSPAQRDDGV